MDTPPLSRLGSIVALILGAIVGYATHPLVWLTGGPVRWIRRVAAMAAQESGYNPEAAGDGGGSVGILQWSEGTWSDVAGFPLSWRTSSFLSGYAAGGFWQSAILAHPSWIIKLWPPYYGYGAMRWGWTHGRGSVDTVDASGILASEGHAASAWRFWLVLTLPFSISGAWILWRVIGGRRGL